MVSTKSELKAIYYFKNGSKLEFKATYAPLISRMWGEKFTRTSIDSKNRIAIYEILKS